MRRFHRAGPRFARHHQSFNGLFWIIGLGVLFFTHWWPVILILVGISLLLGSMRTASDNMDQGAQVFPERGFVNQPMPDVRQAPMNNPYPNPTRTVQAAPIHPGSLLPSACPRCGAPVKLNEVKWTGTNSAACAYCGSNVLPKTRPA